MSGDFKPFVREVWQPPRLLPLSDLDILHAAMGLAGEAGEVLDLVKKHCFTPERLRAKGKVFDEEVVKEMADVHFYLTRLCDIFNVSDLGMESYLRSKLTRRWKEGDHGAE